MKSFILALALIALTSTTNFLEVTDKKIILSIDQSTTQKQIEDYKATLMKRNIILSVNNVTRDAEGKILFIKISVDCRDGFKGSVGQNLTKYAPSIGFYRYYNKDAKSPFGITSKSN